MTFDITNIEENNLRMELLGRMAQNLWISEERDTALWAIRCIQHLSQIVSEQQKRAEDLHSSINAIGKTADKLHYHLEEVSRANERLGDTLHCMGEVLK